MAEKEPKVIYKNFKGRYNKDDLWRVRPQEDGVFLADSLNAFADKTGGMNSREGFISRDSNSYHSCKSFDGKILGVVNENLCRISITGNTITLTILQYAVGSERFNWVKIGRKIYGTNNSIFGYFNSDDNTWTTNISTSKTYHRVMPPGHLIEFHGGRLLIAVGDYIVISDPFSYHTYDARSDKSYLKLKSKVNMIASTGDGFWTSDNEGIYFIKGVKPSEYVKMDKASYKTRENNYAKETGISVRKEYYENCVLMTTDRGICLGGKEGKFINFTEENYTISNGNEGVSFFRRGTHNQYISISR